MKLKKWELGILALLVLVLGIWALYPRETGKEVTVTLAGETLYRFPINQSRTQEIAASQGFSLTMVIENGEVYVEKATCPDLVCQNHRPISRSGEQIICLPGRVVIAITGEEAEIDAVTQ